MTEGKVHRLDAVSNTYFPLRTQLIDLLKQTDQPQAKTQSKAKVLAEKNSI